MNANERELHGTGHCRGDREAFASIRGSIGPFFNRLLVGEVLEVWGVGVLAEEAVEAAVEAFEGDFGVGRADTEHGGKRLWAW